MPTRSIQWAKVCDAFTARSNVEIAAPKSFAKAYPFYKEILTALQNASVRPKTPVYQVVSIDISHLLSPPAKIDPVGTANAMAGQLNNALQSKGLVP